MLMFFMWLSLFENAGVQTCNWSTQCKSSKEEKEKPKTRSVRHQEEQEHNAATRRQIRLDHKQQRDTDTHWRIHQGYLERIHEEQQHNTEAHRQIHRENPERRHEEQ